MIEFLIGQFAQGLGDLFGERHSGLKPLHTAYRTAYRKAHRCPMPENQQVLRDQFVHDAVPGAYADPDGRVLGPWLEAWCDGASPRQALRRARRRTRATSA